MCSHSSGDILSLNLEICLSVVLKGQGVTIKCSKMEQSDEPQFWQLKIYILRREALLCLSVHKSPHWLYESWKGSCPLDSSESVGPLSSKFLLTIYIGFFYCMDQKFKLTLTIISVCNAAPRMKIFPYAYVHTYIYTYIHTYVQNSKNLALSTTRITARLLNKFSFRYCRYTRLILSDM